MDQILQNDVKQCLCGNCESCSREFEYKSENRGLDGRVLCAEELRAKLMEYIGKLEEEAKQPDAGNNTVDHPNHYNRGMECIEEMISVFGIGMVRNFCLLNVWKYRYRAAEKNGEEDIKKSDWYMKKYIELLRERDSE